MSLIFKNDFEKLKDQIHILEKQTECVETMLNGGVDIAVCEYPILMGIVYNNINKFGGETFNQKVIETYNKFDNVNYYLKRETEYVREGRYQDLDGAKKVDEETLNMLEKYSISYTSIGLDDFIENILKYVNESTKNII